MRADAGLFLAYEYATSVGVPVSEVLKLPIEEYTDGFIAYRKLKNELIDNAS